MLNRFFSEIRFRLRALFGRRAMDKDMDAELCDHLEREAEQLVRSGISPAEARRLAHARFGAVSGTKDDVRDARGVQLLDHLARDLRLAFRTLRFRKLFSLGVIVTLALGLGVNAAMFGIVDRLLFRPPLGLRDPGTVSRIYRHSLEPTGEDRLDGNFAFATYLDLLRSLPSFERVVAHQTRNLAVGEGDRARELPVTVASASYFQLFDVAPAQGRFFGAADDSVPTGSPVAVLGYAFWQTEYGSEPVVGKTLLVDRTVRTIIGVAPKGFVGLSEEVPAVYIPISNFAYAQRGDRYPASYTWSWLELAARRKRGVTREAAAAELSAGFVASWRKADANSGNFGDPIRLKIRGELGSVQQGRGPRAGPEQRVALWIGAVAVIVLLIACANVANLLLSRAVSRRAELGMRAALGASRGRIVAQVVTESLVLAVLGGTLGLALAQWGASGLRAWFLPEDLHAGVIADGRTLLFTALATIAAGVVTGLIPALRSGRQGVSGSLRIDGRLRGYEHSRMRNALLAVQAALSVVLLVGAALFVRSLRHVRDYRLGYDVAPVALVAGNMRGVRLSPESQRELVDRLLAATKTVPGVQFATLAASIPFWSNEGRGLWVPGVDSVRKLGRFLLQAGTPDYFRTMGTRILRGRPFNENDHSNGPMVAVVSEGMARVLWPGQEAIGKCFRIGGEAEPCTTVIGIAEEMHLRSLSDPREFTYYLPVAQYDAPLDLVLLVRFADDAREGAPQLRSRLQQEMPSPAVLLVRPLSSLVNPQLRSWAFGATMFAAFGALALLVAALGLYSVMSYDVAQRTREFGVRIALGAPRTRILRGVLGQAGRVVALGVILGGGTALLIAPKIESLLFQQSSRDPMVFGGVVLVLGLVTLLAALVPALRATRVDPVESIRVE